MSSTPQRRPTSGDEVRMELINDSFHTPRDTRRSSMTHDGCGEEFSSSPPPLSSSLSSSSPVKAATTTTTTFTRGSASSSSSSSERRVLLNDVAVETNHNNNNGMTMTSAPVEEFHHRQNLSMSTRMDRMEQILLDLKSELRLANHQNPCSPSSSTAAAAARNHRSRNGSSPLKQLWPQQSQQQQRKQQRSYGGNPKRGGGVSLLHVLCCVFVALQLCFLVANHPNPIATYYDSLPIDSPVATHGIAQQTQAQAPPTTATTTERTCKSFFSLFSSAYLPEATDSAPCKRLYAAGRFSPILERQNRQMQKLDATLTIFTSWSDLQLTEFPEICRPSVEYSNIRYEQFDPDALLTQHGFSEDDTRLLRNWHATSEHKGHVPAQLSDVFRILLARTHQLAYLDLDMFPVPPNRTSSEDHRPADLYLRTPGVAVPIWSEEKGALEIQNSAFCFASNQLEYLIEVLRDTIRSKGPKQTYDFYTELGPNIFQHAIQKLSVLAPTKFLFTTSNDDSSPSKVKRRVHKYHNEIYWFHLDNRFRGGNMGPDDKLGKAFASVLDNYEPKPI